MINGSNIFTPQYVKGGESVNICLGSSAIFCVPNLPLETSADYTFVDDTSCGTVSTYYPET